MEVAAANLIEPGDRALVVGTGYFSERMAEILRRYGAEVTEVTAPAGEAPALEQIREALQQKGPFKALFATHVDTSTGVRVDPSRSAAWPARLAPSPCSTASAPPPASASRWPPGGPTSTSPAPRRRSACPPAWR